MPTLTKRQRQIYEIIRETLRRRGYAPSFEEIAAQAGISSMATIHKHIQTLQAKGAIRRQPHGRRSIELTGKADLAPAVHVPLLGQVAAGSPIEAITDLEQIAVPSELADGERCFALRVRGNSMIDDHIRDGDVIIVERRKTAENGQTVVALIDGAETTVKRLYREGARVRLQPAHPAMKAMVYEARRVEIQGVVVALMRKYGQP